MGHGVFSLSSGGGGQFTATAGWQRGSIIFKLLLLLLVCVELLDRSVREREGGGDGWTFGEASVRAVRVVK